MKRTFLQRIIARVFWKAEVRRLEFRISHLETVINNGRFENQLVGSVKSVYFNKICRQEEYITRLKLRLEQLSREARKNRINLP